MNDFNEFIVFSPFDKSNAIFNKIKFDSDFLTYENERGESKPIFISGANANPALDQFALIGHYLYTRNEEFYNAYKDVNKGKPFKLDKPLKKGFFIKNFFNILLYGIVASNYIKNMADIPKHYLARPIADEKNESLRIYLSEKKAAGERGVINVPGGPFYCYMQKKSTVIRGTNTIICPIKHIIPRLKEQAEIFSEFAEYIYRLLIESKDFEVIKFANNFVDQSWSPYLKEE